MTAHMYALGIHSAMDLAKADPLLLGRKFSVVLEKTVRELAGTSCLALEEAAPAKQEICCSRMFGVRLETIEPIKEAVATYAQRASEKLRAQHSLCKKIRDSIRTGMFNPEEARYANGVLVELPYLTNDVRLITKAATQTWGRLFRQGFRYRKAEVLLMDLRQQVNSLTTCSRTLNPPRRAT
jgi:DNA polymerase V